MLKSGSVEIVSIMGDCNSNVLLVSGPTASGKSSLSLQLAKNFDGEVVNIDSVQVYKDFDIGSAKLSNREQRGVVHHLIDYIDPRDGFNGAKFIQEASLLIPKIQKRGSFPILTGGTTLYVTLLFHGLADLPESNQEIRKKLELLSTEELYNLLKKSDIKKANALHVNDRIRIIRALETIEISREQSSKLLGEHKFSQNIFTGIFLVLIWPRDLLYQRIQARTEQMIEEGLVEETKKIIQTYGAEVQGLKALGYSQILDFISGEKSLNIAKEEISKLTRHYAKRQMTYWRNEPVKRGWEIFPLESEKSHQIGNEQNSNILGAGRKNDKHLKAFNVYDWDFDELFARLEHAKKLELKRNQVWYLNGERLTKTIR